MKILFVLNGSSSDQAVLEMGNQFLKSRNIQPAIVLCTKGGTTNDLDRVNELLKQTGLLDLQLKLLRGDLVASIHQEVQKEKIDLVLIGEWRQNVVLRYIKKPVMVQITESVECPVLVVKGRVKPVRKILLCDSGAGMSGVLNRFTRQIAGLLEGEEEVIILHVMSQMSAGPGVMGKELSANASELIEKHTLEGDLLEQDLQDLTHLGIQAEPKIRHGLVIDEILSEVKTGDYDLLVIGAHNTRNMNSLLLENIAEELLRRSERSVLIVR